MMKKRFTNLKLILLVSAFILINIIYAGSAFAVTQNTTIIRKQVKLRRKQVI